MTTPNPTLTPAAAGLSCAHCGGVEFKNQWADHPAGEHRPGLVCTGCGRVLRWIKAERGPETKILLCEMDPAHPAFQPAPPDWLFVALLRQADGIWRPIAMSRTRQGRLNGALHSWQRGDVLVQPMKPE